MAGTTNVYNVDYHGETNGKICCSPMSATVGAAASDYNSIKTVLSNNSLLPPVGTLVIDAVQALPSGTQTIYT